MARVIRDIAPSEAVDLLERVPRASVGFAGREGPQAEPVTALYKGGRYLVGLPTDVERPPDAGEEVVLVIDEGCQFFDLRAIYVRGHAQPASPEGLPREFSWFEIEPTRVAAWDYGRMREEGA